MSASQYISRLILIDVVVVNQMEQKKLAIDAIENPFTDNVAMIDAVLEGLKGYAEKIADNWWSTTIRMENDKFSFRKKSILGTRIRIIGGRVQCYWYWNNFVTDSKGKKQVYSNHIKLNRTGHGINKRKLLEKADEWEIPHTLYTEGEYVKIRELADHLMKLRKLTVSVAEKHADLTNYKQIKY
jgi:hypothetical protein